MNQNELHNFSDKIQAGLSKSVHIESINFIFKILDEAGFLCWISGGAIRDFIIDVKPIDFDLTTNATDADILKLFPKAILVGQIFGVYKLLINGEIFDLTVFRFEEKYIDGRRPSGIKPANPEIDAKRRDFTMNGLFWDLKNNQLVDYVGGVSDIQNKLIKCIDCAKNKFNEDHLRILRLIRFKYQLNFDVDVTDYQMACDLAEKTKTVSGERLFSEIKKVNDKISRLNMYQDKLFISIMKHNNLSFINTDAKCKQLTALSNELPEQQIFLEIFYLMDFNLKSIELIKNRFKISNQQFNFLKNIFEISESLKLKKDYVHFCLMIDRSAEYFKILKFFKDLDLINLDLMNQISEAHLNFPSPIISAKHIISLVIPRRISQVLTEVRAWQIRNKVSELKTCIDYVKIQYR